MIREDKDGFIHKVLHKLDNDCDHEDVRIENEIKALNARVTELDRKFDQLYDDRFNGVLSDRKFKELSAKCEADQDEARARLEMLTKKHQTSKSTEYGVEQFVEMAEQYGELKELDGEILNRLIQSIVIGDRIKVGAENEQDITVNYRFIGKIA